MTGIPAEVRDVLVCPSCRGALRDVVLVDAQLLACDQCQVAYPVEQGIPVLLRERAHGWPRA